MAKAGCLTQIILAEEQKSQGKVVENHIKLKKAEENKFFKKVDLLS